MLTLDRSRYCHLGYLPVGATFRLRDSNQYGVLLSSTFSRCKIKLDNQVLEVAPGAEVIRTGKVEETAVQEILTAAKAGKRLPRDKAEKPEKAPKAPVERDVMGNRVGSQANLINVAFLAGHRTSAALCKATGFNSGRMAGHLKFLVDHGFATKKGDEYIPTDPSAKPAVKDETPKPEPKEKKSRARYSVFGLNACSVCRTLGSLGWEFDDVTLALETLGCRGMSHATMKMHYVAGKKKNNRWGEPAKLTKKMIAKLTEASK